MSKCRGPVLCRGPMFDIGRDHTYKPVFWANEKAQDGSGGEKVVNVVWWDYDTRTGKATVDQSGQLVDVFVTDYVKADLTIKKEC